MQWPFCVHLALLLDYYKKAAFCLQVSVSVSIFDFYQILKKYHMKKILLLALVCMTAWTVTSCREKTAKEKMQDQVEEMQDNLKDAIDEGADDMKKALDEVGDGLEKLKEKAGK